MIPELDQNDAFTNKEQVFYLNVIRANYSVKEEVLVRL